MDQLSQALNLGPRPMPSACSRLHGRTLKSISRKNRLYLYGVDTLAGFRETARGGSEACQGQKPTLWRRSRRQTKFIPSAARLLSVSATKPRLLSEKYISLSETDKVEQKTKPKTNSRREWLHSDHMITSLANKKLRVGGLAGVDATDGLCRRSVSTRPARPSLYPGLRSNLMRLP